MESILPAETRKPSFGSPSAAMLAGSRQSGWAMMPTVKPLASSTREMIAVPKEGWST